EEAWRKFRAKTMEHGLKTGDALTQAMKMWIRQTESEAAKPNPKRLLKTKPISVGKKQVRWSEEIDETLYGSRKLLPWILASESHEVHHDRFNLASNGPSLIS
ncbi:MAG: hypothetical protein ACHQ03_12100, partial [Candidatus Bathyarchaeia archaeon]